MYYKVYDCNDKQDKAFSTDDLVEAIRLIKQYSKISLSTRADWKLHEALYDKALELVGWHTISALLCEM